MNRSRFVPLFLLAASLAFPRDGIGDYWENLLSRMVSVNTGTGNAAGIAECMKIVIPEFGRLGYVHEARPGKNGRTVHVFSAAGASPRVLFLGHVDTVFDKTNPFAFDVSPGRYTGPGVIDMKGGIVMMLNVLSETKDENTRRNVRIVITEEEETGSTNSVEALRSTLDSIAHVLVFEPGLPNGNYVTAHAGVKWVKLSVTGKGAHAGLEHDLGVNAIRELCEKAARISALTDYSRGLTVNVGTISGGTKANVVPDAAEAMIDIRYRDPDDLERLLADIDAIAKATYAPESRDGAASAATLTGVAWLPAMPAKDSTELDKDLSALAGKMGFRFAGEAVGYGSDGNHLSGLAVAIIDGIGPCGGGMHTTGEFMDIASYRDRLALNIAFLSLVSAKDGDAKGVKQGGAP